jgi:hypothetical protein
MKSTEVIIEAVRELNKGYESGICIRHEYAPYTIRYDRFEQELVFNEKRVAKLSKPTLLAAVAHEYAHGQTCLALSKNNYDSFFYDGCLEEGFIPIVKELSMKLKQLKQDWFDEQTVLRLTGISADAREIAYTGGIEISGEIGELINDLYSSRDLRTIDWTLKQRKRYCNNVRYWSCGGHITIFNEMNNECASKLGVKPLKLGIDEERFEAIF